MGSNLPRVLLVDGDAAFASRLAWVLGRSGCLVKVAHRVDEAQRFLDAEPEWHVVLSAPVVSDGTAVDVLARTVSCCPSAPVVVLADPDGDLPVVKGVDDVLVKPVRPSELVARIEAARRQHALETNQDSIVDALSALASAVEAEMAATPPPRRRRSRGRGRRGRAEARHG